jgi:hypothetical protein
MKTLFKKAITAALFSLCFTLTAQTNTNQVYTTVKDAFFILSAIVQTPEGGTSTVRITNKDVLAALNATGAFDFGPQAKLLLRSVNGGLPYFVVRESVSNEVDTTDVSDYLTLTEPDDAVHGKNSMVNWGIWNYTLNGGGGTDFTFWGLTTLFTGAISTGGGGDLLRTVNLNSVGSGPGHVDGANAQFSGKVTANHARID